MVTLFLAWLETWKYGLDFGFSALVIFDLSITCKLRMTGKDGHTCGGQCFSQQTGGGVSLDPMSSLNCPATIFRCERSCSPLSFWFLLFLGNIPMLSQCWTVFMIYLFIQLNAENSWLKQASQHWFLDFYNDFCTGGQRIFIFRCVNSLCDSATLCLNVHLRTHVPVCVGARVSWLYYQPRAGFSAPVSSDLCVVCDHACQHRNSGFTATVDTSTLSLHSTHTHTLEFPTNQLYFCSPDLRHLWN